MERKDDMSKPHEITRRQALTAAGAAGAGLAGVKLAGLVAQASGDSGQATAAGVATVSCTTVTPEKEPGPYFVDVRLNRSDVRTDTSTGVAQAGIPLAISLYLYSDDNCTPYEGAVVDIWSANAEGVYSDEASENSIATNYLRGYQITDANGMVQFTTNMPGWYSGRTVHLHVEIRAFDSSSNQTFEWQTQLFFGETIDAAVAATSPYTSNPNSPRVIDENDRVWQEDWTGTGDTGVVDDGAEVTPALTGNTIEGYSGTFNIILAGLPSTNADGFGGTASTTTTSTSTTTGTTTTPTTTTPTARCYLHSFHWTRTRSGKRTLVLGFRNEEPAYTTLELRRGKRRLASKGPTHIRSGQRALELAIAEHIAAGDATLDIAFKDAKGYDRAVTRAIKIPHVELRWR
jgi:protocatechuate 3,4-dioxygenase beta subunit